MPAAENTGINRSPGATIGQSRRILLVAGEASGDQHGAQLVEALKTEAPNLEFRGIGGALMAAAGVRRCMDAHELAVVGLTEVIAKLPLVLRGLRRLKQIMDDWRPQLVILIDYPDFNFRVAALAKQRTLPVLYYISPQVWAWRTGRVKKIKRMVDHMAVILPFEPPFYQRHGVPVTYVGHPLLDHAAEKSDAEPHHPGRGDEIHVGLLPGSRNGEISRHLPVMLAAARLIARKTPKVRFILPLAPSADEGLTQDLIAPYRSQIPIEVSSAGMGPVLARCRAAVVASGTATLETALAGVPMVIVYKLSPLSYHLGRRMIAVEHIGLVNLIARERIAVELIQEAANPAAIAREVGLLLSESRRRRAIQAKLSRVRERLGTAGAARRVARIALDLLALPSGSAPQMDKS
jgi:lipid-A-disaccharide synthase